MKKLHIYATVAVLLALLAFVQPASAAVHISDGGFELGTANPYWQESSTNGYDLITTGYTQSGTYKARLGSAGFAISEVSKISQEIALSKNGTATLRIYLQVPGYELAGSDKLIVKLDGDKLLTIPEAAGSSYITYTPVYIDISDYLDGETHTLTIKGTDKAGSDTTWFIDDVAIFFDGVGNTSMEIDDNGDKVPDGWKITSPSGKAKRVCDYAAVGSCSVRLPGSGATETLAYTFKPADTGAGGDQFNFWYFIATEGIPAASVTIMTDIFYTNGTHDLTFEISTLTGTHGFGAPLGWAVNPTGPYKKIRVSFMYTASVGRIWVDGVQLVLVGFTP